MVSTGPYKRSFEGVLKDNTMANFIVRSNFGLGHTFLSGHRISLFFVLFFLNSLIE